MNKTIRWMLAGWLCLASLQGCAPNLADVQNPQGFVNLDAYGRPGSPELVLAAIRLGATNKHWHIVSEGPGVELAQVSSGGHDATVRIDYNERGWLITHQSSSPGLKYRADYGGRQVIHHRYNMWVRHLNRSIENALMQLQMAPPMVPTAGGPATLPAAPAPTMMAPPPAQVPAAAPTMPAPVAPAPVPPAPAPAAP